MQLASHEKQELVHLVELRDNGTPAQRDSAAQAIVEFFGRIQAERDAASQAYREHAQQRMRDVVKINTQVTRSLSTALERYETECDMWAARCEDLLAANRRLKQRIEWLENGACDLQAAVEQQ